MYRLCANLLAYDIRCTFALGADDGSVDSVADSILVGTVNTTAEAISRVLTSSMGGKHARSGWST